MTGERLRVSMRDAYSITCASFGAMACLVLDRANEPADNGASAKLVADHSHSEGGFGACPPRLIALRHSVRWT